MQNANPANHHAFLNTIARCLSGNWLIDPTWLLAHADLMARSDRGEDMSAVWPKAGLTYMLNQDGGFQSATKDGITGKGSALGVISVVGPIYKYGWNSSKSFLWYLSQLAKDDQVGGVNVKIDSPGGQNAGTREVFQAIQSFPKPILITVDGIMASAALYQGAGASKIVATQPTDQVGSLGTYNTYADWNAYYESFGLKMYETYAPGSTEKNESYRQVIESQGKKRELLEQELTVLNDQFISDVRDGRGTQLSKDVEKGRLYFAPEAKEKGLIDDLIPEGETLALLADMQQTTKQSTIQMGLREQILQLVNGAETQTAEQLTAQVTQLTTERDAAQGQVASLTTERDTARQQVTQLTTERDTAQTQVTTLTTERDAAQALAEQYGAQPGEKPTTVQKTKDEIPKAEGDKKTLQQIIDELPSEKEAREAGY